jgi:hypothetical protein
MKKTLLFGLLLFNAVLVFGQSISKTMLLLPDTGQTTSYTTTFGEDHDYAINTPSYTDSGDGTITDNVTGLMWQKVDGGSMSYASAITYCDNLTLANYTDWRLPTPMEAFSIMILQNGNPAVNTSFFLSSSTLVAEYWWTNATQLGDNSKIWCTNAGGGIGNKPKSEAIGEVGGTFRYNVRAVRNIATPTTITNHFTDNGDGTVTDNLTQLIWQKVPSTTALTWDQALIYAEGLSLGNTSDWRLPNIKELQSLNNELAASPSVFLPYFQNLGVKNYWSSTTLKPNSNNPNSAWYWFTQYGITTYDVKTNTNYVICVKGNQSLGMKEEPIQSSIKVYPNPASNYIMISFIENSENPIIELSNSAGQIVLSKEIKLTSKEYRLNTEKLLDGFYVLTVINGKKRDTFKIIFIK